MSTLNVPTIPRNVADAIESFRKDGKDNAYILRTTTFSPSSSDMLTERAGTVRIFSSELGIDTLLAALVNGYERDKTPDELKYERIRNVYDVRLNHVKYADTACEVVRHASFADGIKFALNELGINVEGVNA